MRYYRSVLCFSLNIFNETEKFSLLQGLTKTLYSKTQAASSRQRKEFVPKTLDDLGIETSCDLSLTAPHLERQLRGSGSSRSD